MTTPSFSFAEHLVSGDPEAEHLLLERCVLLFAVGLDVSLST
ncbi:MAG: hypothetical protein ACRDK2_08800 [Solirubrobacteraceae bacterium]